jgi:hypothetical protein
MYINFAALQAAARIYCASRELPAGCSKAYSGRFLSKKPSGSMETTPYIGNMTETRIKKSPEQKLAEATEGLAAYRAKEAATHSNMLRLRAERLAREAESPAEAVAFAAKPTPRKRVIRK